MRVAVVLALFALPLFTSCGEGQDHCAEACDKVTQCSAKLTTPFACGQTSAEKCEADPKFDDCAHCLIDNACADITSGKCDSACK